MRLAGYSGLAGNVELGDRVGNSFMVSLSCCPLA